MKLLKMLSVVSLAIFTAACSGQSTGTGTAGETVRLSIGAASPGGGFHQGATALSTVVNEKLPNLKTSVEVTGASKNNVELMQAGEIELGLSSTEVAWEAYNGKFTFDGTKFDKLRTLFPGWPGVYMFITLKDSGINSVKDLEGKKFSSGPKGSANEVFSERVFQSLGVKPSIVNLPNSDAADALKDGTIDGFALAWPTSAVTELETTHELKIVMLTEEEKAKFLENNPPYPWLAIPKGTYKALPEETKNFGLYNLFIVRDDIPEDVVYNIVKTAYENMKTIEQTYPQMAKGMVFENIGETTIPYHPGAIKYFQEQGVTIPEALMPPK